MKNTGRFAITVYTDDGGAFGIECDNAREALCFAVCIKNGGLYGHTVIRVTVRGVKW